VNGKYSNFEEIPMQPKVRSFFNLFCAAAMLLSASLATATQPYLPSPVITVSTIPPNGDVNPYGVAFVPANFPTGGLLQPDDILVSNFNNFNNLPGMGTTIMRIRNGVASLFFQGTAPLGLSTALVVLKSGYVLAGNLPSLDGTCNTASDGSILVINSAGQLVTTIINNQMVVGPWDATVYDQGSHVDLFISNAINGSISRLNLTIGASGVSVQSATTVASGYMHQCDPASFFDSPTGLAYEAKTDTLYVASTLDNDIFAVPEARLTGQDQGTGTIVYQDKQHLHGALAMAWAPNGDLLVTNNDVINSDPSQPSEIVEFTTAGQFVKELSVDPIQGGSFGLKTQNQGALTPLAAVDDNKASLIIWTQNTH
jgi:hypothetical protein